MNPPLLSYREALEHIQAHLRPRTPVQCSWRDCLNATLVEDLHAREDVPAFDNSAMDGFALRSDDVQHAGADQPVTLRVIEEIFAGPVLPKHVVGPGQAAKIMTGAPLPQGANAVVMVENTRADNHNVHILHPVSPGANVRLRGEEIRRQEKLLPQGIRLDSAARSLIASQGILIVTVRSNPRVALLATGDELVEPEEPVCGAQVRNVNLYTLTAELERFGCPTLPLGVGRDSPEALRRRLEEGLSEADMLLTSGGVSAGEKDFLPSVLSSLGMQPIFHKVSVRPGKPLLFGLIHEKPVFGLPGNVVSSLVTYHLFVKPALRLLVGRHAWQNPVWYVRVGEPIKNPGGRTYFVRCVIHHTPSGLPLAFPVGKQGSGMLSSMVGVDGLAVIPADVEFVEEYTVVEFIPLHAL